jgi:hypothetical protein
LVVGAMALGATLFNLGVFCWLVGWPSPPGIAGVGVAGVAIIAFATGTTLGAIVGFVVAVRWIMTRKSEPWKPSVWRGVILGILFGLALSVLSRLIDSPPQIGLSRIWPVAFAREAIDRIPGMPELVQMIAHWPVAALLTAALGMVGGLCAKFGGSSRDRHDGNQPRN